MHRIRPSTTPNIKNPRSRRETRVIEREVHKPAQTSIPPMRRFLLEKRVVFGAIHGANE